MVHSVVIAWLGSSYRWAASQWVIAWLSSGYFRAGQWLALGRAVVTSGPVSGWR
ncbi:hypothetical protein DPMN_081257 [Dreissena polymorpha]|uniref:Uncharacterized protein n=1 Tax=Dreissena polymorpha TaxID=45954 RepID=A0A9D4BGC6_DREPO|nr:hypothetical protein DPMN_081257 [Dreissena polymorpha]